MLRGEQKADLVGGYAAMSAAAWKRRTHSSPSLRCWRNHRLHQLPSIAVLFERLRAGGKHRSRRACQCRRRDRRPAQDRDQGTKARFKRDIVLDCKQDESLIAGAVIRVGDLVIDGSARGRLDKLATALSQ